MLWPRTVTFGLWYSDACFRSPGPCQPSRCPKAAPWERQLFSQWDALAALTWASYPAAWLKCSLCKASATSCNEWAPAGAGAMPAAHTLALREGCDARLGGTVPHCITDSLLLCLTIAAGTPSTQGSKTLTLVIPHVLWIFSPPALKAPKSWSGLRLWTAPVDTRGWV